MNHAASAGLPRAGGSAGQLSVLSNGFIPLDEGTPLPAFLASVELPRVESTAAALVPVAPAAALAAPAQAKTDANLAASPRGREITRIVFRTGSASLDPDAMVALARVASTLKDGGHKALITGHADSSGSREANQRVARARATVVRDSLHAMGVSLDLMTVDSAGADSPTASNDTPAGRALNRRVDIELVHD